MARPFKWLLGDSGGNEVGFVDNDTAGHKLSLQVTGEDVVFVSVGLPGWDDGGVIKLFLRSCWVEFDSILPNLDESAVG